ncbi:MAG TPA: glycosyltransferase [Acidimicrobiia bacterium]|nr:glycosyltransferase [Acidimicrobiia bacterium]
MIVPCRNVGDTLGDQLDALTRQSWSGGWEIVVVDNGSTDDTRAIADDFARRCPILRVESATSGIGVSYVRNAGARASTAAAVAFCDGDDVVGDGWVAAIGTAVQRHALVTGPLDVWSLNEPALARSRGTRSVDELPRFGGTPFARGNNCGLQRSVFDRLEGFDERYRGLEDIELSLRAAALGCEVVFVPDALVSYRYRDRPGALWRQGIFYGSSVPALAVRARRLGLPAPARFSGLRSWAWLLVHLGGLARRDGRLAWVWVLANRVGVLVGSVRSRTLYV